MNARRHSPKANRSLSAPSRRPTFEPLEARTLLSAGPAPGADDVLAAASQAAFVGPLEAPAARAVGTLDLQVTNQWTTGFQAKLVLTNTSGQSWDDWTVQFDLPDEITSIWDAVIDSHEGGRLTIGNANWNGRVAPGRSVSFGIIGRLAPGSSPAEPANVVINRTSPPEPPANTAPIAGDDTASTRAGAAVAIDVLANDTDADADALSLVDWAAPGSGTVAEDASGRLVYTPAAGFTGTDSFAYTITDGADQASATVRVSVTEDVEVPAGPWPGRFFAPYLDATLPDDYNMAEAAPSLGVDHFVLAFIVADPTTSRPSWGGYYDVDSGYRADDIQALRDAGGDVMISFGGAANTELAVAIADTGALTEAYQSVIDAYGLTMIDFDIEGAWVHDSASVDRRSEAIARLQQAAAEEGRPLEVWLTLPVLPSGLTADGVAVVESALRHGADLGGVNVMTMDYGDGAAPNPSGQMGEYAIMAAESVHGQLAQAYAAAGIAIDDAALWRKVGVTPMIGQNDVGSEVFDLEDARQVVDFAQEKNLGMIGMWSANRDSGGSGLSIYHSGIDQAPNAFQTIFAPYTGDAVAALSIADAQVVESDGQAELVFAVALSQPADSPVTVHYATADGSAIADSDYQAGSGVLTFAAGQTQREIRVVVTGDRAVEPDETLAVMLSDADGATLRDAQAVGTILDDDTPATVSIGDATVAEGDAGTTRIELPVELSRDLKPGETVTVAWSTRDGTAGADDYVPADGTLVFTAGDRTASIGVDVLGDTQIEPDETFRVNLDSAAGATIGSGSATGTIADDDAPLGEAALTVTSDWATGLIGQVRLTNSTDAPWTDWRLTFRYPLEIGNIWNAEIVSHQGDLYVVKPASWTRNLPAGGSVTFGFEAAGSSQLGLELIDPTLSPVSS